MGLAFDAMDKTSGSLSGQLNTFESADGVKIEPAPLSLGLLAVASKTRSEAPRTTMMDGISLLSAT